LLNVVSVLCYIVVFFLGCIVISSDYTSENATGNFFWTLFIGWVIIDTTNIGLTYIVTGQVIPNRSILLKIIKRVSHSNSPR